MFLFFFDFYVGFWAREGLEMVWGWIRIHLDQVSAQMDHSGSILGPFLISIFLEIRTRSHLGSTGPDGDPWRPKADFLGPTGPDGDPWMPKADFWEAEGRRRGVWGRRPQEKNSCFFHA